MAQMISCTVYQINSEQPLATPATFVFPVSGILIRPPMQATVNSTTMNATVQVLAGSAPQPKNAQYHTNSTVAALATLAG